DPDLVEAQTRRGQLHIAGTSEHETGNDRAGDLLDLQLVERQTPTERVADDTRRDREGRELRRQPEHEHDPGDDERCPLHPTRWTAYSASRVSALTTALPSKGAR